MKDSVRVVKELQKMGHSLPDNSFFKTRYLRNIEGRKRRKNIDGAWQGLMVSILSTRQRSTGGNNRTKIALGSPYLKWSEVCSNETNIAKYVQGFTDNRKKVQFLLEAFEWLSDETNWHRIKLYQRKILSVDVAQREERLKIERSAAKLLTDIRGIGPKQSRNFWQYRGYSVWTIPLDSRVQKIITQAPFGINLDLKRDYETIEEQLALLCSKAKTYPCMLDASLFDLEAMVRAKVGLPP